MNKRILYVATLFRKKGCSASIRNVALVNALVRLGADVTVVTAKFPLEVLDSYLVEQLSSEVNVVELEAGRLSSYIPKDSSTTRPSNSVISRVKTFLKQVYFFPSIDKPILSKTSYVDLNGLDIVISSSDTKTSHIFAEKLLKNSMVQWAQIWGDPWENDVGISSRLMKYRAKHCEKKLLLKASYIFYVSLPTLNQMSNKYSYLGSKMNLLPRSFFEKVNSITERTNHSFNLVYTGSLTGRNIKPVVEAINAYNAQQNGAIKLTVFGKVDQEQKVYLEQNPYIQYRGSVSLKDTIQAYGFADGLLFLSNKSGASQIPGKLYDYFGTNKPILALVEDIQDGVAQYIKSTERCSLYKNQPECIDLLEFVNSALQNHDILSEFSPDSVAKKLINVVDN